jgi:hypothetical protein
VGRAAVLQPKQPEATQTIDRFLNPPPPAPPQAPVSPAEVRVQVLNGSGRKGEANTAAQGLRQSGFALTAIGDASSSPDASVIRYGPGAEGKAALLQGFVVGGVELRFDPTVRESDVVLVTGRTFGGIRPPAAGPATGAPPPAPVAPDCPP